MTEYELGFGVYPYILTKISTSNAFLLLYLSVVCVTGLSSLLVLVQNLVEAGLDCMRGRGIVVTRHRRWALQMALCSVNFIVGVFFTTQVG